MNEIQAKPAEPFSQKLSRLLIVVAGIVLGQLILFGPSLMGQKVLLPLDLLALPGCYLAQSTNPETVQPRDPVLLDLLTQVEPDRRFAARELKSGRFPFWTPGQYGGVPFIWPKYSPFFLLTALTESPVVLAWAQMLKALVSGIGAYFFCRTVLRVSFWPAAFVAWCYPISGFFTMWQGYPTCAAVYWLPWLLLTVDRAIRSPGVLSSAALAFVTALVLVSGHIDVAGQALLVSGLYALWCLWDVHRRRVLQVAAIKAVLFLVLGWCFGMALAAPHVWPLVEYARTGYRISQRAEGLEERPPVGLAALPRLLFPDVYGSAERGSLFLQSEGGGSLQESTAAGYAGLLATLLAAPLAWFSRRHFSTNLFWVFLAIFGLSWCLNLPGFVAILALPGLKMMSHNRLVFATSFAILALTATGLEALRSGLVRRRPILWIPALFLGGLLIWSLSLAVSLPEPIATQVGDKIRAGQTVGWIRTLDHVRELQAWFTRHYLASAVWCGLGLAGWLAIQLRWLEHRVLFPVLGVLLTCDLLWFAWGRQSQCDRELYFPEIPALAEMSKAGPGRVIGHNCLPAKIAQAIGLTDPRGYDGVDPARWVELLKPAADQRSPFLQYASTQSLVPRVGFIAPDAVRLSPILDMMNVRYVIFRGPVPQGVQPQFQSPDYWIMENRLALPRVFVPSSVEVVTDDAETLRRLSAVEYDPRAVAYLETPIELPAECRGEAAIKQETPSRILVEARMDTPGLLVLSDYWEKGWHAYVDGKSVPILRANYAVRGVALRAGTSTVEFRYESETVKRAFQLSVASALLLFGSLGSGLWQWRNRKA